ncbi:hypothetical protein [Nocardia nepalensis]
MLVLPVIWLLFIAAAGTLDVLAHEPVLMVGCGLGPVSGPQ